MKFSVKQSALLEALNIAAKCLEKSTLRITECFLFDISRSKVVITACNMRSSISYSLEILGDGSERIVAIPGLRLKNLIADFPEQFLDFSTEVNSQVAGKEAYFVKINAASGEYIIPCEDEAGFPVMKDDPGVELTIRKQDLLSGIDKTVHAAAKKDDGRPAFLGVYIVAESGKVTFTGTDGILLNTFSFDIQSVDASALARSKSAVIPAVSLSILKGIPLSDDVTIIIGERNITVHSGDDIVFKSILISEAYPDYKKIIPFMNDFELTVNRPQLMGLLRRVGQFANETTGDILLTISEGSCLFSARNEFGEHAKETIEHSYIGEPIKIAFKAGKLISALYAFEKENISIYLKSYNRPALIADSPHSRTLKQDLVVLGSFATEKTQ